jgi:hypothetical protein
MRRPGGGHPAGRYMEGAGAGPAIVERRPGPVQQVNPLASLVLGVPVGELYP